MVHYNLQIKTGNVKNAGTDSNIYIQVFGDKGDTGVVELKQICDTKERFQRGKTTKIPLYTVDVGNVSWFVVFIVLGMSVGFLSSFLETPNCVRYIVFLLYFINFAKTDKLKDSSQF